MLLYGDLYIYIYIVLFIRINRLRWIGHVNRMDSRIMYQVFANQRQGSEISSSHGGEYDVQSCLLGYTAV
jgi:hypothetical protein